MRASGARAYYVACFYLSLVWFAAFALVFNALCAPLLILPGRSRVAFGMRRMISLLFRLLGFWFRVSGVVRVTWIGFDRPLSPGTVYVANHPTLVDATMILSRLTDAVCLMKSPLMRNFLIAPAAVMAEFVASEQPVEALLDATAKLIAGRSILLFPEGTRTPAGAILGTVNPAFIACAERARAPIQLIVIQASPDLAPKGRAWWRPPSVLPGSMRITLDRRWEWNDGRRSDDLIAKIEQRIRSVLGGE
jgi:1-acyl-sn-glycerol-3-phosphate acyltransferase